MSVKAKLLSPPQFLLLVLLIPTRYARAADQCKLPQSTTTDLGVNNLCQCAPGWFGPTCAVCMDNRVCRQQLKDSDGVCRDTTYTAVRAVNGWCEVNSTDVNQLIHGQGYVQLYFNSNASFFFEFVKRRGAGDFVSLFRCSSSNTKVQVDPQLHQVKYVSPELHCAMSCEIGSDRTCTNGLANIVNQVGQKSGSTIVCSPSSSDCDVHEYVLDTFLGGVKTVGCRIAECALKGEESVVAVSSFAVITNLPPEQQTSYILGMLLLAGTLLFFIAAWAYFCQSSRLSTYEKAYAALYLDGKEDQGGKDSLSSRFLGLVTGIHHPKWRRQSSAPDLMPPEQYYVRDGQTTHSVVWESLWYRIGKREILRGIFGCALPGELLAIMGPSGSGKTTLIDILAMKAKRGSLQGKLLYSGQPLNEGVRECVGFVDQEDNLMGTLTVYEAVLFSALLRLPNQVSMQQRAARVMQILSDLRIQHVADAYIGIRGRRGISGGEKRRVVVACELVKVPSILFLDEPTSGLDSFNAALLVDCLRDLALRSQTNVVMTIHQPRSNVYSSFDRSLVMNQGEVTYFGRPEEVSTYFASIGHPVPDGYNPADFLIDVLFVHERKGEKLSNGVQESGEKETKGRKDFKKTTSGLRQQLGGSLSSRTEPPGTVSSESESADTHASSPPEGTEWPTQGSESSLMGESPAKAIVSPANNVKLDIKGSPVRRKYERDFARPRSSKSLDGLDNPFATTFLASEQCRVAKQDSQKLHRSPNNSAPTSRAPLPSSNRIRCTPCGPLSLCSACMYGVRRWLWEIGVLSRRSMLDLWRSPLLFFSHLGAAVYFAVVLGTIYYDLSMRNLQAIQNRLGVFLLSCAFLIFTSVSALPLFWLEKSLYLHEQSNRFYCTSAYFVCKIIFDLIPLRVLPVIAYSLVTYFMIGLRPGLSHLVIYTAFLVLLSTTSAVLNLIIGMLTKNIMSGILIATIVMIHFLMLTNLFINFDSMNIHWLQWLKRVSFMNYAYEGMAQNELVGRKLEDFEIRTGQGVLVKLGFSTSSMWFDLMSLHIYLIVAIVLALIVLKLLVKELR